MTNITSDKRKVESSLGGDSTLSLVLRYTALFIIDAFALIVVYTLLATGNIGLGATLAIATIGANIITFMPSLTPLRWMLPGLVLVTCFVIFPIFYTVYTAFTNYDSAGHLLTKRQTIDLISNSRGAYYAPDGARFYEWTIFQSETDPDQLALWLTRTNDSGEVEVAFAPVDAPIQDLDDVENGDVPDAFDGYVRVTGADRIPLIQVVEREVFGEEGDTVGIAGAGTAARPLDRRLVYDADADTFTDVATGIVYVADESIGEFVSQPLQLVYDVDAEVLTVPNTNAVYTPDDSGIFTDFGLPYRYDTERGGLFSPASNAFLEADASGIVTVPVDETLIPGYRVWVGSQNFERVVEDNFNVEAFEAEDQNFFQQFANAFNGELFTIFIWTFMFAFLSVFTTFWVGLFMAIILNDAKIPGKKIIRSLLIIPYAIPGVIGIVVWQGMLNGNLGIISTTIADIIGAPFFPFQNANTARIAVIVVNLWLGYPYMMLICSGALQAIPSDIYEAAAVDGATPSARFWQITLPLLLVTVGPLLIASFVFNFNNYLIIEALTAGDPPIAGSSRAAGFTDILISYVYQLAFGSNRGADYGYASAITIIIFFITAGITIVQYRFTRTWEEVGENV